MEDYAILIILFLMAVCLLILTVIGYWGVFCKAGEKGWKVLIPFYNEYLLFKIAWKPSICLIKWLCLFGHGFGYTVGIMFLPFIFVLLLGVGRSRYTRPDKYRDKF